MMDEGTLWPENGWVVAETAFAALYRTAKTGLF
jgi:hypothetical protein